MSMAPLCEILEGMEKMGMGMGMGMAMSLGFDWRWELWHFE